MSELAELLEMKLMLSTTPVMSRGDSGLKLRDLVIEVSRWILGGNDNFTLTSNRWPDRSSLHPQKRRRPPLPDGRDGQCRSFVHGSTREQQMKRMIRVGSVWLMAPGARESRG